jgi:hypothetical protein
MGNGMEFSVIAHPETDYVAAAAGVENVDEVSVLGYRVRFTALGELSVGERQVGAMDSKHGEVTAAGVDGKEQSAVLAESQGALRFEGIVVAAAAATAGGEFVGLLQGAIGGSFVGDDFVPVDGIGHDEDGMVRMLVLCVAVGWGNDADGERDHPEDVNCVAHFRTPVFLSRAELDRHIEHLSGGSVARGG